MARESTSGLEKKVGFFSNIKNFFSDRWKHFKQYVPAIAGGAALLSGLAIPMYFAFGLSVLNYLAVGGATYIAGVYVYSERKRYKV